MCSISVQEIYFVAILFHFYCTSLEVYICEFTNSLLHVVLLLSNTAWQHATPIVSFTCVGIDYAGSAEDWRQVEDLFDRIRNCGESGGRTDCSDVGSIWKVGRPDMHERSTRRICM